jgi:hypothetical protein
MDNKYGSMLINGKRVDELTLEIPFMNVAQCYAFANAILDIGAAAEEVREGGYNETIEGLTEPFEALIARQEILAVATTVEVERGIATGQLIKVNHTIYERHCNGLLALRSIFGDMVTDVYVDRNYLLHKQIESQAFGEERIIKAEINVDENIELDIGGMNMVVKFTDGRLIEMTNSEWGAFTRIQ